MLKVRVIPTLLWRDLGLVKGVAFDSWRAVGTVLPAVKVYNMRDVDELIVVDIAATGAGRAPDSAAVADFSSFCLVPLTVGGGITDVEQIGQLLRSGADKISLNTVTYDRPELISDASRRFGSQCVVASVDVRRREDRSLTCASHSGSVDTGRSPVAWVTELEDRGAGEILLTSVDRDGTMHGYDLELVESVASAVNIPVIASGGAGTYLDMVAAVEAGASAVAAGSMFHFTEQTPAGAKQALAAAGVPVRNNFVGL